MIVDYDRLSTKLIEKLTTTHKMNYFTVDDVKTALMELKEPLATAPSISPEVKTRVKEITDEELLETIYECTRNITDMWDRDNLALLKLFCEEYEYRIHCDRFQDLVRYYDSSRKVMTSCRKGCSSSFYGCLCSLIRNKGYDNRHIISESVISMGWHTDGYPIPNPQHIVAYKYVTDADIICKEIEAITPISDDIKNEIKYIIAEPDSAIIKHSKE